jgi:hypothetical protein
MMNKLLELTRENAKLETLLSQADATIAEARQIGLRMVEKGTGCHLGDETYDG